MSKPTIILSERSKCRLSAEEMQELREYIKFERTAYITITRSTGIQRRTILLTIDRGWIQFSAAKKLRDFLKELKKIQTA